MHSIIPNLYNNNIVRGPNYFDTKEVMEVLHIFHFESVGEELFDVIDIGYVLSSNDQVVNTYTMMNDCPLESHFELSALDILKPT